MSQPRRWWIGILPLALIWLLTNHFETLRVENELLGRARPVLEGLAGDMVRPEISAAGRDLTVAGAALRPEAGQQARDALEQLPGVRLVNANIVAAPAERPYRLGAARDGGAVTLTGFAPNLEAKTRLLATAKTAIAAATITDRITLGAGAPPQWEAAAAHGLTQLAKLARGAFVLIDLTYSLEGVAASSQAYAELANLASTLPEGARPGKIAVTPPPADAFFFAATREADTLTLEGHVTSLAERDRLLAAARAAAPGLTIVDRLAFASNAPAGFVAAVEHGLGLVSKLRASRFELRGNSFSLRGIAPDSSVYDSTLAALGSLPSGASAGAFDIQPPEEKPYVWRVRRNADGTLVLEGVVPDRATLEALLAQARQFHPQAKIVNALRIARTAPAGFAAAALLGLEQIGRLKSGLVEIADGNISIKGEAADQATVDGLARAFAALQGAFARPQLAIETPPPAARPAAPPAAPPLAPAPIPEPEVRVIVPIPPPPPVLVEAPPPSLRPPASAAAPPAAPAPIPEPEVRVIVPIPAPPPVVVEAPPAPAVVMPRTITAETAVEGAVAQPSAGRQADPPCTAADGAPLLTGMVQFAEGSAILTEDQRASLGEALGLLKRCSDARIRLEGHTNTRGGRLGNIWLSSRRTFAVSRFLQSKGVARSRIETIGFGEDRLLMPETSAEGVVKNRRVEFTIR